MVRYTLKILQQLLIFFLSIFFFFFFFFATLRLVVVSSPLHMHEKTRYNKIELYQN